jgi:acetolactate synthase-1/2/3 large subunit
MRGGHDTVSAPMSAVADAIVKHLKNAGVAAIFGMPGGGSNLDIVDAAGHAGLPFVLTATETGAAIAAAAQAEITGKPGACISTLGPGVASIVNGIACASLERAPLIVITDAAPAPGTYDHQRIDHHALLAPVTKWSATITAANVDAVMREAIARASANPAGAVHLELSST